MEQREKMTRTISTTISDETHKLIRDNHLHYNNLIVAGLRSWKEAESTSDRLRELEEGNIRLQSKLTFLSEQYIKSQSRL